MILITGNRRSRKGQRCKAAERIDGHIFRCVRTRFHRGLHFGPKIRKGEKLIRLVWGQELPPHFVDLQEKDG